MTVYARAAMGTVRICAATMIGLLLLVSCSKPEPVRIGFVGGLSGRVADLGGAGRNGAMLAVEQRNAAGGINGRPVELVVRDDQQQAETARLVVSELISRNIELIIGPMTSSMAMVVTPLANASRTILLSPTVTTTDLTGKDDSFLRVISDTSSYSSKSARYQYEKLGVRNVAVIYDVNNSSYAESWLKGFRTTFEKAGGRLSMVTTFRSAKTTVFHPLAKELLSVKPDTVLIIANAVDAAIICQQLRRIAPRMQIALAEWASTERFIELAGAAAERVTIAQFLDRNNRSPRYQQFLQAYRQRFNQEPGFAGTAAYDAALLAMEAYANRARGTSLKETILAKKEFQGVQQLLHIDRFGDTDRSSFIATIRDGNYITLE